MNFTNEKFKILKRYQIQNIFYMNFARNIVWLSKLFDLHYYLFLKNNQNPNKKVAETFFFVYTIYITINNNKIIRDYY